MSDHIESTQYTSFLVRLWHERNTQLNIAGWRVEIEHIQSGQCWKFNNMNELIHFLRQQINEDDSKNA